MILNANDFGCVPDGRFLESASMTAGAPVLIDLDGVFRATDVGKNIAVPGAIDLVTTIARLLEHREVRNASMDAGSNELRGTLFDPQKKAGEDEERFRDDLHEGRRITVEGAGPNGGTLVSDIVDVQDATTIKLAESAQASISGTRVIVNRPDRVALDNYARRSVENVTVNLGDRTIGDGKMTIGGRGLISDTAKFSSLDLAKEVTIRAAGLLVTTIQSFTNNTKVTLAAPAQHEVSGAVADVWQTDSRPGLELLLAAFEAMPGEPAEIVFGPGVYDFSRISDFGNPMNAAIGLRGRKDLGIRGWGQGVTVLRLMPNQDLGRPDTHVIETVNCTRLTIRDLSVHGAYLTMGKTNEQMHGIFLNEGSQEVVVERVRVFQTAGDGIRFLGKGENPQTGKLANKVRNVWVDGCQFVQNKRTGVSFQRGAEFVWIRGCYIEMTAPSTDSCIDFEPTGFVEGRSIAPSDIIIESNILKHDTAAIAVSISGIARLDPTRRVKFSNNVVNGGALFCTDVDQLTIQDNAVLVPESAAGNRIPILVQRGGDTILISGNLLVNEQAAAQAVLALTEVNQRQVTRAIVANNLCFARSGDGIRCFSSDDVSIQGNMIVATASCTRGILLLPESSDMDNISVRDNDITADDSGAWQTAVQINSGKGLMHHVSILGNSVRKASEGIAFRGSAFAETPVCALNRIGGGVTSPIVGIDKMPQHSIVVGGATSNGGTLAGTGAGRFLSGFGDPNNTPVTGNVGDIFLRLDGGPGQTLYVNEPNESSVTGWVAK